MVDTNLSLDVNLITKIRWSPKAELEFTDKKFRYTKIPTPLLIDIYQELKKPKDPSFFAGPADLECYLGKLLGPNIFDWGSNGIIYTRNSNDELQQKNIEKTIVEWETHKKEAETGLKNAKTEEQKNMYNVVLQRCLNAISNWKQELLKMQKIRDLKVQKWNNLIEKMLSYTMPLLNKRITLLQSNMIVCCLERFADVYEDCQVFGPLVPNTPTVSLKFKPKATRFAFVINTSDNSGSHWVGLFVDAVNNKSEYFDSMGSAPSQGLQTTNRSILLAVQASFPTLPLACNYNGMLFQTSGADCGVYATKFLQWKMVNKDKSLTEFRKTEDLSPQAIRQCRSILWNEIDYIHEDANEILRS